MSSESEYTPWPDQINAMIQSHEADHDTLWFQDPEDMDRQVGIPATTGPHSDIVGSPVWHYEIKGDYIIVSPSIHFIGYFHSPNPAIFNKVDSL